MVPNKPQFRDAEVMDAAPDAIAHAAALRPGAKPHPLAERVSLHDIALAAGRTRQGAFSPAADERELFQRGYSSLEFSQALADGVRPAVEAAFANAAEYLPACATVAVTNYKPTPLLTQPEEAELEATREGGELKISTYFSTAGAAQRDVQLTRFRRVVAISREAIINQQAPDWGRTVAALGASAARIEAGLLATALEANGDLEDGAPLFDTPNTVAETFAKEKLFLAMSALRKQPLETGAPAGWRAAHLLVAANIEGQAIDVVYTAGLAVKVAVLPGLPDGRWYLLADAQVAPTIAVLRMPRATLPLAVEALKPPLNLDGAAVRVSANLGVAILRRHGIVKGGT